MNMIGKMSYVLNITTDCYRKFIIFFQVLYQIILFAMIEESVSDRERGNLDINQTQTHLEMQNFPMDQHDDGNDTHVQFKIPARM